jgi:hypothetical protein
LKGKAALSWKFWIAWTQLKNILNERMKVLKVKELLAEKCKEGFARERDKFCAEIKYLYGSCI